MGLEAATKALLDAGITYDNVQVAFVGYCYGDSTSGQVRHYIIYAYHINLFLLLYPQHNLSVRYIT